MNELVDVTQEMPPPSGREPVMKLVPEDIGALLEELQTYHAEFSPLFQRREQASWAEKYMQGQMLPLERKSIQPMAMAVEGGNVQAMQQFISQSTWEDEPILRKHRQMVAETLGHPGGVLVIDGCEFPKQGKHSVGVKRQWCGALGKIANCQASVLSAYVGLNGFTLVDRKLYLPQDWFTPEHAERWRACGIPEGTRFRTRPKLAWESAQALHEEGILPFEWVVFDEAYGGNPALRDQIDALGLKYLAEVPVSTLVWARKPRTEVPPGSGKGRPPERERLATDAPRAKRADALANCIPAGQWQLYTIKEGTKGPMAAQFAFKRVWLAHEGLPTHQQWLILRRGLGEGGKFKVYLSNAPVDTPVGQFVRLSGMRWPIERAIKEAKGELGMDHYELRTWAGWHHHMTLTMLSHHFLVRVRLRMKKRLPH
jgi:SRSO17 transposase